ncbi:iron-sulfur assembly protein IscA, chloroplastic isoform X1 [Typha angustifolia]|uniref:iron-sulfur assembly protein IscA, chloroplastic isoform X1 n=1 Tax=Typha angustifolia TaxID=59011 RepID=UPI003C2BB147
MALSLGTLSPLLCRVSEKGSRTLSPLSSSLSFSLDLNRRGAISIRCSAASAAAAAPSGSIAPAITLSDKALNHLSKMRAERNEDLCLRIGVKQGGCSGMSYTMEFENLANRRPDDSTIEYNGFKIVCDPKSLLFVYGMQLDFSDALIGGGFSFKNPNATKTCGCGKSFATEDNGITNSSKEASCTN